MSPDPSVPALAIEGLCVDAGPRACIQDVSLSVARGEFHGLLGPNGAGKTTLLRALYFANRPRAGTIRVMGRPQADWPRAGWSRQVGALVQDGGLLAGLTIRDIVDIGLTPLGLTPREKTQRAGEALEIAGLDGRESQMAATLSGGELQRAYFAQLLARDPEIYVLDEPTNHLDLHYQLSLLDEVKRRGRSVLATMHDLTMAARYCDRVTLISAGRTVASGAVAEVLSPERLAKVYRVQGSMRDGALALTGPLGREAATS